MKLTGPDAVPPPSNGSIDERMFDRFTPAPDPRLKICPSFAVPVENRIHRVVDREDEARTGLLGNTVDADVEPHRAVERGPLCRQHVLEFGVERLGLRVVGEVTIQAAPLGDRVDDPVDDGPERPLTLGAVELPAEVLLRNDVAGVG